MLFGLGKNTGFCVDIWLEEWKTSCVAREG